MIVTEKIYGLCTMMIRVEAPYLLNWKLLSLFMKLSQDEISPFSRLNGD